MTAFNGLGVHLGNLYLLSDARSRSLSAENVDGRKGGGARSMDGAGAEASRELPVGWKKAPCVRIADGATYELAAIDGPGAIQQIWMTLSGVGRLHILRMYWDNQKHPSVEVPLGDFFCSGWGRYAQLSSMPVCVNPGFAWNSYWEMPFRKNCRMTVTNLSGQESTLFYQVNYALTEVPEDAAYFHAQFRRANTVAAGDVYTLLDGVEGWGQYVGTYMAWGVNSNGWWGEGEIKFYLDGDSEFPTICGTGTEDYFCGSYNFDPHVLDKRAQQRYQEFTTPYAGLHQVIRPDGVYDSQQRFGLYRWHIPDPVRFEQDLRVTMQCLGWKSHGRYCPRNDDLASVAFWYQTLPTAPFPALPDAGELEVV